MPFWCTCNHITQNVGEWKDHGWKSGKYDQIWYTTSFKEPLVVPLFLMSDNIRLGCPGWPPRWNKDKSITSRLIIRYPTSTYYPYLNSQCIKYGTLHETMTNVPHNVLATISQWALLIECDEIWWWGRGIWGDVGFPSMDMLIIIVVMIIFFIVGNETLL